MLNRFRWLAATLAIMLLAPAASAQPPQAPAPTSYVSISYLKALPGQGAAYRTWITTTSKKFYQELMSAEPRFVHWDCAQNMYQGMDQQDFDYLCVTVTVDGPLDPARDMEPIFQKLGTTSAGYQARSSPGGRWSRDQALLIARHGTPAAPLPAACARQLADPVLDDDDGKVVAVLDHQERPAVRRDVFTLVPHQVQRVRTVEQFDRRVESQRGRAHDPCAHHA
jgi:hypothetical protein